jgi:hypothetical protein
LHVQQELANVLRAVEDNSILLLRSDTFPLALCRFHLKKRHEDVEEMRLFDFEIAREV